MWRVLVSFVDVREQVKVSWCCSEMNENQTHGQEILNWDFRVWGALPGDDSVRKTATDMGHDPVEVRPVPDAGLQQGRDALLRLAVVLLSQGGDALDGQVGEYSPGLGAEPDGQSFQNTQRFWVRSCPDWLIGWVAVVALERCKTQRYLWGKFQKI